jgi:tRNA-specific 2-thiouridylase
MSDGKTVFVGLSGGVDSSVAAARLLAQGYNVVGVFIKVWHPDFLVCNWEQERLDAMRVAARLGIPFLTCDAEAAYRDEVARYFINSYKAGITPNPDVMCNKEVKFGAFLRFALERGATHIATGHYAQVMQNDDRFHLLRGVDTGKDQSYFLWTLTQDQLAKTLLPVGNSEKIIIRQEAAKKNLLTADKKDSQGICFLGHVDIPDFLSHYIDLIPGGVINEHGTIIGHHDGAFVYTIGQRHGFTITKNSRDEQPHYVIAKNIDNNTITVSTARPERASEEILTLTQCNQIQPFIVGRIVDIQTRYRQKPTPARITSHNDTATTLTLLARTDAAATGQSCVLYGGNECIGGGIIS